MDSINEMILGPLPVEIYQSEQIRQFEQIVINQFQLEETELMRRAGEAAFKHLELIYPQVSCIAIICGPGNNAGDGYYLAKLAKQAGMKVHTYYVHAPETLKGAAAWAMQAAKNVGVEMQHFDNTIVLDNVELIVDALFGTGLTKEIKGKYAEAITWINQGLVPVFSLDLPSGICGNTGRIMGVAVVADFTLTFIGLKSGLLTSDAIDYSGQIAYDPLGLSSEIFLQIAPFAIRLTDDLVSAYLMPRARNVHKGDFGHIVIAGGDFGMAGAVSMAANAALRVGAGMVTVVTRQEHIAAIVGYQPEVMAIASEHVNWVDLLAKADVVIVGPGLGRSNWSEALYLAATQTEIPLVIDADGLYFLKKYANKTSMILTPHPGEAAQLLGVTTTQVQQDRYQALALLKQVYPNANIVLKGAGSLMLEDDGVFSVCNFGNAGMATAGMGDILTGVIAGLWAQGQEKFAALELGVLLHAMAGDLTALAQGERGMLATDLLPFLQTLVNPKITEEYEEDFENLYD